MIPLSIHIKGFGPHSDTFVDWTKGGNVTALVAPNGSGKTFLLEAALATLFGVFPSRPGPLADCLTLNGTGEGELILTFEHRGETYTATRSVKAGANKAWLRCGGDDVAGPKIGDYTAAVEALIGDKETALATWMSSQGGVGDLTNCQPSERRDVFGKLLDFDRLNAISDNYKDAALKIEAEADVLDKQLQGIPDYAAEETSALSEIDEHREHAARGERSVKKAKADVDDARKALLEIESGNDVLRDRVAAHQEAEKTVSRMQREMAALSAEIEVLTKRADRKDKAEKATSELVLIEAELKQVAASEDAFRAYQRWERRRDELAAALETSKATSEALASLPGCDATTKAKAATLEGLRAEAREARAENVARVERNGRLQIRREDLKARDAAFAAKIADAEARIAATPKTPFGEQCVTSGCQFLAQFAGLPAQIAAWKEDRAKIASELAAIPADEPQIDMAELVRRGTEAAEAQKLVDAAAENTKRVAAANKRVDDDAKALTDHIAAKPAQVEDPTPRRRDLDSKAAALRPVASELIGCKQAEADLVTRNAAAVTLDADFATARNRVDDLSALAKDAQEALAGKEAKRAAAARRLEEAEGVVTIAETSLNQNRASIARLEERLEQIRRERARTSEKLAQASTARSKASRLRMLQTAFGKRGIQPIIIDQAAPELEAIAASMLDKLTDGRMRLSIATQRALKGGGISEDFLILAADARGPRDVSTFSGGEKRLLQTVLRVAVMLWAGRKHGRPAETICIDESFDALDAENAERMVEMLKEIARQFGRVIVISHEEEIAAKLPSRIALRKSASGVAVSYN